VKRAEIYAALLLCAAVISLSVARADALPEDATLAATPDDIGGHSWCRRPASNETQHILLEFHKEWHSSGTYFGYTFTPGGNKQIRSSAGSWEIDENHILKRWGGGERYELDFMSKMSLDKTRFYQKRILYEREDTHRRFWGLWCQCDQAPRLCP
jgi:hypothetical protein